MKNPVITHTIIIGGGPAGLFAGLHLKNRDIILLEKNSRPGKKLLISGSGRCNITHEGNIGDFFHHYGDNSRFLKSSLMGFTNKDLINFLSGNGLKLTVDKNGKVFPASEDAKDVLKMLINLCLKNKVQLVPNEEVTAVENTDGHFIIRTSENTYQCMKLLIATGGKSYPGTGSTGDGYRFAQHLGHTLVPPRPALTPVFIRDYPFAQLAGVSLVEVPVSIYRNNKKIKEHRGDIGFTHTGLSGPGILDPSRFMEDHDTLKINFCGENPDVFRNSFIAYASKNGKIAVQTYLKQYNLPKSLVKEILARLKIDPDLNLAMIDKKHRNLLTESFCEYPFFIEKKAAIPWP